MIFITLGSQKFQFDRLLKTADELAAAGKMKDSVFAQTGYSNYKPKYFAYKNLSTKQRLSGKTSIKKEI